MVIRWFLYHHTLPSLAHLRQHLIVCILSLSSKSSWGELIMRKWSTQADLLAQACYASSHLILSSPSWLYSVVCRRNREGTTRQFPLEHLWDVEKLNGNYEMAKTHSNQSLDTSIFTITAFITSTTSGWSLAFPIWRKAAKFRTKIHLWTRYCSKNQQTLFIQLINTNSCFS